MPTNYDAIDLELTRRGDLAISNVSAVGARAEFAERREAFRSGDVLTTVFDQIRSTKQFIYMWLKYSKGDFRDYPDVGLNLDDFVGEPNTRETANSIKSRIINGLIAAGIVRAGDIDVSIIPIDLHSILITISIKALATANNSLDEDQAILTVLYDNTDGGIIPFNTEGIGG